MDAAMVSTYEIENALRARNTRLLRRAIRLESDERYDLIKDMPMCQFQAAAQLLIEHGENANKIQRMAERNKVEVNKQTTVRDILAQAAKAGDEEAIELLASGLGAVAICVGIWGDAISGISRVPGQAARSIG